MENTEKKEEKKIGAFCAIEQQETAHTLDIDGSGEVVLTCECGHFVKYPKGTTGEQLQEHILKHAEVNAGQVSVDMIEAEKEKLLAGFN